MEEKQTLEKLLYKQNRYAKWQCILTAAAALCCVGIFVLALTLMPQIQAVIEQMNTVLTDLEAVTNQLEGEMDTILSNLNTVTDELARADLEGMVADVDSFVTTGQEAVEQATEKLNIIDFETLNQAIEDLADVVEPLAKFFNVFN